MIYQVAKFKPINERMYNLIIQFEFTTEELHEFPELWPGVEMIYYDNSKGIMGLGKIITLLEISQEENL